MDRISVSTLNEYSFCPRSVYLSKVLKLKTKPTKELYKGLIGHAIRKELSLRQAKLIGKIENQKELLPLLLLEFENILNDIPYIYKDKIGDKKIIEFIAEIRPEILNEISLLNEKLSAMLAQFGINESLRLLTPWKVEYSIRSDKLKLSGRIDKVMKDSDNGIIPVEIKTGGKDSKTIWEGDKIQACAYAMLLEEKFNLKKKISYGFIEYTKIQENKPVMTTEQLRRKVIYLRDEIIDMIERERLPEICPHGSGPKCESCRFKSPCYEI